MATGDSEHKLLELIKTGDAASFDRVFMEYHNKIFSFSYRYLQSREEAEGVVQHVFMTLWNKRETLHEIRNLNAWLFTVTFNQIRKIFRNTAIVRQKMDSYAAFAPSQDNSTLSSIEFNDMMLNAEDAISQLPKRQRTILLLRIKEGLSSEEISKRLEINKRTVENHLSSARSALRKILRDEQLIPLIIFWILLI